MSQYQIIHETKDSIYKKQCWETATGMQDIDGLKPSEYLYSLANQHIEGAMSLEEIETLLYKKYETETEEERIERKKEADIVTARITGLLSDQTFTFSPEMLKFIHKTLFVDIYDHAGKFRECNIYKKEAILHGETVKYANYQMIEDTFVYDFEQEKRKRYAGKSKEQVIDNIASFISGIWQVHPFMEGNTRTTAVFIEKYLNTIGFSVDNTIFAMHSKYFRNALVRANYADFGRGLDIDTSFLERFFGNLLFEERNELSNRDMIIKE